MRTIVCRKVAMKEVYESVDPVRRRSSSLDTNRRRLRVKYLMLVLVDPEITPRPGGRERTERWVEETGAHRLLGNALQPKEEAKVVRVRGGKPFVTDGPFAETK